MGYFNQSNIYLRKIKERPGVGKKELSIFLLVFQTVYLGIAMYHGGVVGQFLCWDGEQAA